MTRIAMIAAAAALTAGFSSASGTSAHALEGAQCFFTSQIENFNPVDDHTLYMRLNPLRIYRIDLANTCPNLPYRQNHISLESAGGSGTICNPVDITLTVGSNGTADHCIVKAIHQLTPAEAAALPKGERP